MVTNNTEVASSEDAPSPVESTTLPVSSGDEPLIPEGFIEGIGVPEPEAAATAPAETTGDETSPDDSATDTPDSTEETPAAETTETPEAETTSTETTPAEGDESTPRVRTNEEWNKRESTYRQQQTERDNEVTQIRQEMQQLRASSQDAMLKAEAQGYITALTTRYTDEGQDPAQAAQRATSEVNAGVADWQTQQENAALKEQVRTANEYSETTARQSSVSEVMRQEGVPERNREILNGFTDARLMVATAKELGAAEAQRQETIKAKQAEVPAGGPANTFDGASGNVGGQTELDWIVNVWNKGLASGPEALARSKAFTRSQGG